MTDETSETMGERFKRLRDEFAAASREASEATGVDGWHADERLAVVRVELDEMIDDPAFADYVLGLESQLTAANARADKAEAVLQQISRMRLFPDDKTNRFTLHAAKQLATNYFAAPDPPPSDAEGR